MRSHAKASSAGSTERRGNSLGRIVRGAFATRGDSSGVKGSGAPSRRRARLAIGLLVTAIAALSLVLAASASVTTRLKTATFSPISGPQGVAVDQSTGDVYVIEQSAGRIARYTSAGAPSNFSVPGGSNQIVQAGLGGAGEAQIAVDNAPGSPLNGAFYVKDGAGAVAVYASSGEKLGELTGFSEACGVAVDQSSGALYVGDYSYQGVRRFMPTSATPPVSKANYAAETSIKTSGMNPCQVAADKTGRVYASAYNTGPVKAFNAADFEAVPPSKAGTTISATSLTVTTDPSTNDLYVDEGNRVSVFNSSGTLLYRFGTSAIGSGSRGVAVKGGGSAYVSNSSAGSLVVFGPAETFASATATLTGATAVTDTSATLNATVTDNNVLPTNWRIELSKDGGSTWSTVSSGTTTGGQSGVAVSGNATGLTPNSPGAYRYRVVTNKGPEDTDAVSSSLTFSTLSVPPVVSNVGSVQVQDTSARLVATIDPRNSITAYVINYGTTVALGTHTAPVEIGGGTTPLIVSQVVKGLAPDTTYYFRIEATNEFGTTNSVSKTLRTRVDPLPLPDDRAYEQVSPPDKNGGDVLFSSGIGRSPDFQTSPDGDRVAYTSSTSVGDPSSQHTSIDGGVYYTRRTANGWENSRAVMPPEFCTGGASGLLLILTPHTANLAHDLSSAVFNRPEGIPDCSVDPLFPNAPNSVMGTNLYRSDLGDPASYSLLNPDYGCFQLGSGCTHSFQIANAGYRGANEDQSLIILDSQRPQTPDSLPNVPNDNAHYRRIYQWTKLGSHGCTDVAPTYNAALNACLALVSIDPVGNPIAQSAIVPGTGTSGSGDFGRGNQEAVNSVSDNGDRIFFQSPECAPSLLCELYMRESGAVTHQISQSECTVSCGSPSSTPSEFHLASPSGDTVAMTSQKKLTNSDTNSAGTDLYVYRHSANPTTDPNLTFITPDNEPSDGSTANVLGVPGGSDDLNTIFFVAQGQLVAGKPIAAGPKLYRWSWNAGSPTLEYLATLNNADEEELWERPNRGDAVRRERRVTPDGGTLMIETAAKIDPVADQDSDIDVYRWSEADRFQCVSCQLPGAPSGGRSDTGSVSAGFLSVSNGTVTAMTDDGEHLFFVTQDSLVPEDTNGPCVLDPVVNFYPCTDVYEWHDGALSLITPGDSADPDGTDVQLVGITPSGNDVFFGTRQALVGWDQDKNIDVYDASIGGGFPEPDAQGDICEGEACRDAGSNGASIPGAGSASFQGAGNQSVQPTRCPKGKRRVTRGGKSRCVPRKQHKGRQKRTAKHDRRASR